jgi:hypothetical protein
VSFLAKKAPLWSLVLAVLITAGAFTTLMLAVPQLADSSQALRDYSLAASPSSLSMSQGSTTTTMITASSVNGFDLSIGMTATVPSTMSPFLLATLSSNAVTPISYGKADTVLTVTALTGTPAGTYQITLTSSGGTRSHTLTIAVTVGPEDFTLLANPSPMIAVQGSFNTSTITVTSEGGFSGNVSLTVTAPLNIIGVAGGPSPVHLVAGGVATSTVTVEPSSLTTPGTYNITVTGTSGILTHTIDIIVTVKTSSIGTGTESMSLDSYSYGSNTNATLHLRNYGTVNTTLVSYYVKDASGDTWDLLSWNGPTIDPSQVGTVNILIGTSCPSCTYTGTAGAFTQFSPGYSYTITVITARNNQFTYTITR